MKHPFHTPFALIELGQPSFPFQAKRPLDLSHGEDDQSFSVQLDNLQIILHLAQHTWLHCPNLFSNNSNHSP
jgi:hypothetical protein